MRGRIPNAGDLEVQMRRLIVVIPFVVFVLCGCGWKFGAKQQPSNPKFITYKDSDVKVIPGDYLVVFDTTKVPEALVEPLAKSLVIGTSGTIEYIFTKT